MKEGDLSGKLIGAYYTVYNALGYGFLEKVYENSLFCELKERGIRVTRQQPIDVYYKGKKVGQYFADLVIEDKIIVELKAAESLCLEHEAQLMNYLKATSMEVGFLFNFGREATFKRKYFSNEKKNPQKSVSSVKSVIY